MKRVMEKYGQWTWDPVKNEEELKKIAEEYGEEYDEAAMQRLLKRPEGIVGAQEVSAIKAAKQKYHAIIAREEERKKKRCQWKGFDHKGRPAICLNDRVSHEKTRQLLPTCGFHVSACVMQWPTSAPCAPLEFKTMNKDGLCIMHYRGRHQGKEPPQFRVGKQPGTTAAVKHDERLEAALRKALAIKHPLAPKENPPDWSSDDLSSEPSTSESSDFDSDDDEASDDEGSSASEAESEEEVDWNANTLKQRYIRWKWRMGHPARVRRYGKRSAIILQTMWRAKLARAEVTRMRRTDLSAPRRAAVVVIEKAWQGYKGRVFFEGYKNELNGASSTIAKAWRHSRMMWFIRQQNAGARIARWWHSMLGRQQAGILRVKIKGMLRRKKKKEAEERARLEAERREIEEVNALKIQRVERGRAIRKFARLKRDVYRWATSVIGYWWHSALERSNARRWLREARSAAIKVQSVIRMMYGRRRAAERLIKITAAAIRIQANWRGRVGRIRFRKVYEEMERRWQEQPFLTFPRDSFYWAFPKSRYNLRPAIVAHHGREIRRGTLFELLPKKIKKEDALTMQFIQEGIDRFGPDDHHLYGPADQKDRGVTVETDPNSLGARYARQDRAREEAQARAPVLLKVTDEGYSFKTLDGLERSSRSLRLDRKGRALPPKKVDPNKSVLGGAHLAETIGLSATGLERATIWERDRQPGDDEIHIGKAVFWGPARAEPKTEEEKQAEEMMTMAERQELKKKKRAETIERRIQLQRTPSAGSLLGRKVTIEWTKESDPKEVAVRGSYVSPPPKPEPHFKLEERAAQVESAQTRRWLAQTLSRDDSQRSLLKLDVPEVFPDEVVPPLHPAKLKDTQEGKYDLAAARAAVAAEQLKREKQAAKEAAEKAEEERRARRRSLIGKMKSPKRTKREAEARKNAEEEAKRRQEATQNAPDDKPAAPLVSVSDGRVGSQGVSLKPQPSPLGGSRKRHKRRTFKGKDGRPRFAVTEEVQSSGQRTFSVSGSRWSQRERERPAGDESSGAAAAKAPTSVDDVGLSFNHGRIDEPLATTPSVEHGRGARAAAGLGRRGVAIQPSLLVRADAAHVSLATDSSKLQKLAGADAAGSTKSDFIDDGSRKDAEKFRRYTYADDAPRRVDVTHKQHSPLSKKHALEDDVEGFLTTEKPLSPGTIARVHGRSPVASPKSPPAAPSIGEDESELSPRLVAARQRAARLTALIDSAMTQTEDSKRKGPRGYDKPWLTRKPKREVDPGPSPAEAMFLRKRANHGALVAYKQAKLDASFHAVSDEQVGVTDIRGTLITRQWAESPPPSQLQRAARRHLVAPLNPTAAKRVGIRKTGPGALPSVDDVIKSLAPPPSEQQGASEADARRPRLHMSQSAPRRLARSRSRRGMRKAPARPKQSSLSGHASMKELEQARSTLQSRGTVATTATSWSGRLSVAMPREFEKERDALLREQFRFGDSSDMPETPGPRRIRDRVSSAREKLEKRAQSPSHRIATPQNRVRFTATG